MFHDSGAKVVSGDKICKAADKLPSPATKIAWQSIAIH